MADDFDLYPLLDDYELDPLPERARTAAGAGPVRRARPAPALARREPARAAPERGGARQAAAAAEQRRIDRAGDEMLAEVRRFQASRPPRRSAEQEAAAGVEMLTGRRAGSAPSWGRSALLEDLQDPPRLSRGMQTIRRRHAERDARAEQERLTVRPEGALDYYKAFANRGFQRFGSGLNRLTGTMLDAVGADDLAEQQRVFARDREYQAGQRIVGETTGSDLWRHRDLRHLANFLLEQGIETGTDTAVSLAELPLYVASMVGRTGQQRAQNDHRDNASFGDMLKSVPTAVLTGYLDRAGLGKVVNTAGRSLPARLAGHALNDGFSQGAQSAINDAGGSVGTERGFDLAETGQHAILNGLLGLGTGTLKGGFHEGTSAPRTRLRQRGAILDYIGDAEFDTAAAARSAMSGGHPDAPLIPRRLPPEQQAAIVGAIIDEIESRRFDVDEGAYRAMAPRDRSNREPLELDRTRPEPARGRPAGPPPLPRLEIGAGTIAIHNLSERGRQRVESALPPQSRLVPRADGAYAVPRRHAAAVRAAVEEERALAAGAPSQPDRRPPEAEDRHGNRVVWSGRAWVPVR